MTPWHAAWPAGRCANEYRNKPHTESLVGLRMTCAMEVLDHVLQRLEKGELTAIQAIDEMLSEEYASREGRRVGVELTTARLAPACRENPLLCPGCPAHRR